jgi:hypothetical protein
MRMRIRFFFSFACFLTGFFNVVLFLMCARLFFSFVQYMHGYASVVLHCLFTDKNITMVFDFVSTLLCFRAR